MNKEITQERFNKLKSLTVNEKFGCVALWINYLYTYVFIYETSGKDAVEIGLNDYYPCQYCLVKEKCPCLIRDSESQITEVVSIPLVFKSVLELFTGPDTVIGGIFPANEKYTKTFLEDMAHRLKDNFRQEKDGTSFQNEFYLE